MLMSVFCSIATQTPSLPGHRQAHGLQADHGGIQNLAKAEGRKPVAQSHPGRHIPRRHRDQSADITERRLTTSSPKFSYSSINRFVGIAGGVASLRQRGLVTRLLEVQFGHPPSFVLVFHVSPLGFQRGGAWESVGDDVWSGISAADSLALPQWQPLGQACASRSSSGSSVTTTM